MTDATKNIRQEGENKEQKTSLAAVLKSASLPDIADKESKKVVTPKEILERKKVQANEASTKSAKGAPAEAEPSPPSAKEQQATPASKEDPSLESSPQEIQYQKLEKSFKETQRWGRGLSQKLKSLESQVKRFQEEGILTDGEAQHLMEVTAHEAEENHSPLMRYSILWDQELENMKKYTDMPNLDQKVLAFQHLLKQATGSELEELLETFKEVEDDPIKLTRKMLEMGEDYLEDVYEDLSKAGSLKALKKGYTKQLESQRQSIDKLKKELVQLKQDGYVPSTRYGLPSGGSQEAPKNNDVSLRGVFTRAKSGNL